MKYSHDILPRTFFKFFSGLSAVTFYGLWYFQILRVDADTEVRGIDISKHGEPAYPTAAYGHGWDTEGSSSYIYF